MCFGNKCVLGFCHASKLALETFGKTSSLAFQKSVNNGRLNKFSLASKQGEKRFETPSISRLRAPNFNFLVCVQSSSDMRGHIVPFFVARFLAGNFTLQGCSEPPCRAHVFFLEKHPEAAAEIAHEIQNLIYKVGADPNKAESYFLMAQDFGVSHEEFSEAFYSDDLKRKTRSYFSEVSALGVQGFPALLCGEKGRESFLANGYVSFDEIKPRLDSLVLSVKK